MPGKSSKKAIRRRRKAKEAECEALSHIREEQREVVEQNAGETDRRYKYSLETREKCVAFALREGNVSAASRKYGVPRETIRAWVNKIDSDEVANIRAKLRTRVMERAWGQVMALQDNIEKRLEQGEFAASDTEAVRALERLSKVLDNIGAVVHKHQVETSNVEERRKQASELEQYEQELGMTDADMVPKKGGGERD